MKKIGVILFGICIVPLLAELFLANNEIYFRLQSSNVAVTNWYFNRKVVNEWPNTLIMGSSPAAYGVDPNILQQRFQKKKLNSTVQNIALKADTALIDYTLLSRLLSTCQKCPENIVYIATDLTFKNGVYDIWQNNTANEFDDLYLDTNDVNDTLKKASRYSDFYNSVYSAIELEKLSRLFMVRKQLLGLMLHDTYHLISPNATLEEQSIEKTRLGFSASMNNMTADTQKTALDIFSINMHDYSISEAEELLFDKYIKLTKRYKVNLIIVLPPIHKSYIENYMANHGSFEKFISAISKKNEIPIINNTSFENGNANLFSDPIHLNAHGADVYSHVLANELTDYINKW